jgi:hypothetical protein
VFVGNWLIRRNASNRFLSSVFIRFFAPNSPPKLNAQPLLCGIRLLVIAARRPPLGGSSGLTTPTVIQDADILPGAVGETAAYRSENSLQKAASVEN